MTDEELIWLSIIFIVTVVVWTIFSVLGDLTQSAHDHVMFPPPETTKDSTHDLPPTNRNALRGMSCRRFCRRFRRIFSPMTDEEKLIEIVGRAIEAADTLDRDKLARAAIAAMQPHFKAERIRGGEMVKEAALAKLDEDGSEIEAALTSEGIYVWGPDGERFERMFDVVMIGRRALSVPAIVEAGDETR